jgi:hypothetical protein
MHPRPLIPRHRSLPAIAEERESFPSRHTSRPGRTAGVEPSLSASEARLLVQVPPHERYSRFLCEDVSSPPPPPLPPNVKDLSNLSPVNLMRVAQLRECLIPSIRQRKQPTTRSLSTSSLLSTMRAPRMSSSCPPHEITPNKPRRRSMYPSTEIVESLDLEPVVLLDADTEAMHRHNTVQVSPITASTRSTSAFNVDTVFSRGDSVSHHDEPALFDDSTNTDHSNSTYESLDVSEPTVNEARLASYTQISSTYFEERNRDPVYLEIEPGRKERLRGTAEMIRALQLGFVRSTCCLACQRRLLCIANVAWVVCPDCRSISPTYAEDYRPGVGLGMKL